MNYSLKIDTDDAWCTALHVMWAWLFLSPQVVLVQGPPGTLRCGWAMLCLYSCSQDLADWILDWKGLAMQCVAWMILNVSLFFSFKFPASPRANVLMPVYRSLEVPERQKPSHRWSSRAWQMATWLPSEVLLPVSLNYFSHSLGHTGPVWYGLAVASWSMIKGIGMVAFQYVQ